MDWTDRFDGLTAPQQLGVAAMLAERVLPLAGGLVPLEDGLRLVWMQLAGRTTSKLEFAHVLNAAIEAAHAAPAGGHAARATLAVLESAQHNPDASREAVAEALKAVGALDAAALAEELVWLSWAITAAATTDAPTRTTFQDSRAPSCRWTAKISSADLPLFGSTRR